MLVVGALALVAALVVLILSTRSAPSAKRDKPATAGSDTMKGAYTPPPPRVRTYKHRAEPPIIDEVLLDKTELCAGETFMVTVKAHSVHPEDDIHLHGVVDGHAGMRVPLVARRNRNPKRQQMVAVFGRNGKRAMAELPEYTIKDCVAERTLQIGYRLRVNTNSEYEFSANIMNLSANDLFEVASYSWDFGDGTSETTSGATVIHDYGRRKQESVYSNMLVRVTARATTGESLVGRRAIQMRNAAFANLVHAGVVTLVVELTPRFPRVENGLVTQGIRLWHHRLRPIKVARLRARKNFGDAGTTPVITSVSIVDTLGTATIPPAGIAFDVVLDARGDPNLRSIDFLLDGVSAEGIPVKSVFSVMRPADLPTPESHVPVTDPLLTRKIIRARALLGRDYVSDEDIWRLQREGKLDDIEPGPEDRNAKAKLPPIFTGRVQPKPRSK